MDNIQVAIEVAIALFVVFLQLSFFLSSYNRIKLLTLFLPKNKLDESFLQTSDTLNGTVQLIKVDTKIFSKDFIQVIESINKYLVKNQGATDFSIIKSIVERSIETKESSVISNVSLPLYIGLMGTFVGIIIGLLKIAFWGGVTEQNINSFIGGVVIAMLASFFGLFLTVLNNSKNFSEAKAICDERKNNFYDFLQVVLLPHLGNSLFDALDRLKYNINDFNRKFEGNIKLFDTKFSDNITSLRSSVHSLSENIGVVVENTKTQKEFLEELKKIGYNRMAEANIKVFQILREAGPTFVQFIEKQKELNQSVEHAVGFAQTIENILNRIKTFEEGLNNLGESLDSRQYLGNEVLKRIDANLIYLDRQFDLLKQHETKSTEKISDFFSKQYEEIEKLSDRIRREIESAFNLKVENNPLQKLYLLESIETNMNEIKGKVGFNGEFKKIGADINSTMTEIQDLKRQLTKAISDSKANSREIRPVREEERQNKTSDKMGVENGVVPKNRLWNRFVNLFKRERGRKG